MQAAAPPRRGEVACRGIGVNGAAQGPYVLFEDGLEQSRYRSMAPVVGLQSDHRVRSWLLAVFKALPGFLAQERRRKKGKGRIRPPSRPSEGQGCGPGD